MKDISVIGIGKLGLCFSLTLEKNGFNVLGVDLNEEYVKTINQKKLETSEPGVAELLKKSKNFVATTELADAVKHSDVLFVIVATPSLPSGRYDHAQVDSVIQKLIEIGRQETRKHFIVCCTVMPGYCDSIKNKLNNLNYSVSYNPEFIAQGTILRDQANPDMVLIGEADKEAGDLIQKIYEKHTENKPKFARMTPLEAEITKISLNCFLTTKIAYANMIGDIVKKSGGDPNVVLQAIGSDSRIGNKYLKYGYGFGGPCFPRDNKSLGIYAEDLGMPAKISNATDLSNKLHLEEQVKFFENENSDKSKTIVFDTVTYKPESDLLIESQQLAFAVLLAKKGYKVLIKERKSVIEQLKKQYQELFLYEVKNG